LIREGLEAIATPRHQHQIMVMDGTDLGQFVANATGGTGD
jgi:hypothetical protein